MANWRTSSEPLELPVGPQNFKPLTLEVEAGTGTVQIQRLQSDGVTWAAAGTDSTLTESDVYRITRANSPRLRIVATGNAKFSARGQ